MSFRYRLVLFLVVALVAVQALTATFAYLYLRQSILQRAEHELGAEMVVFARQLDFLSERVSDGVSVLSLDYALRSAIAQQDHDTELSALHNHGDRIGAARMMLIGLDGRVTADTGAQERNRGVFPFAGLLIAASERDKGTALATLHGRIFWIVVVPVRAPVPIAFIAAFIPVGDALLGRLREISADPRKIILATQNARGQWQIGAESPGETGGPGDGLALDPKGGTRQEGSNLIVSAPLVTAKGSEQVMAVLSYPLDEAFSAYRAIVTPLLLLLGFALLAAVAGAMLIVRGVSRPLERLGAVARRIALGDYSPPPRLKQRDEIGYLADALSNMTQAIAERETGLRNAVEAAEFARNEAVKANEAKSQFLGNMSHELRTPLNAIVGFSEMIGQEVLGPVGQRKYIDYARDIHQSGEHLLRHIQHMLDIAEAESKQLTLAKAPVRLSLLLEESVAALRPLADKNGVHLLLEPNVRDWPELNGDMAKLRQSFINVIHNAIKFTSAGGEVRVTVDVRPNSMAISVTDDGVGMDADALATVVRPFHRLRSALDGQHQGAGLGLPFAKIIVELHGGKLSLSSAVGIGTTVMIELPAGCGLMSDAA